MNATKTDGLQQLQAIAVNDLLGHVTEVQYVEFFQVYKKGLLLLESGMSLFSKACMKQPNNFVSAKGHHAVSVF